MLPEYGEITINNGVGESAEMAATRTWQVIQRAVPALEAGEDVICVAHAHILRILATQWFGSPSEAARMFELGTARFSKGRGIMRTASYPAGICRALV